MYDTTEVLASGLSVARMRVNVLASNIANAQSTRTEEGGPYKRKDVVQMSKAVPSKFSTGLDRASLYQPSVLAVVEDQAEPRKVFNPGHPDADKSGYVSFPNINIVSTMTDLMSASRLYEANVTALETARKMNSEAMRIVQVA
jgi:flagellar basal-body rod protein FlgC